MFFIRGSYRALTIRQGHTITFMADFCSSGMFKRRHDILTKQRKLGIEQANLSQGLYPHPDTRHGSESFTMLWRHLCSQQTRPGLSGKDEDAEKKFALRKEDLVKMKDKEFLTEDISSHNRRALGEMDKKIKDNIKALEDDLKKKKNNSDFAKYQDTATTEQSSDFTKYREMMAKYLPVKISSMEELQAILKKEFDEFKMSDLNYVPPHVLLITLGGLVPFLIPLADVAMFHGYTPSMEFIQITYSSLLLTMVGGIHLSSRAQDILHNQVAKESIPSLVYPFTLAWLSLLTPGLGLVLNSTGLLLLWLEDVQKTTPRPPWYKSLRFLATSTAIVSMTVMVASKVVS